MKRHAFALVAVLALAGACGRTSEETSREAGAPAAEAPRRSSDARAPGAEPAPAEQPALAPGQSITTEGAVHSVGTGGGKLDTPAYAPLFPGARVSESVIGESGVGRGGTVTYSVAASPREVIDFYVEKAKATGKPITMNTQIDTSVYMLTAGDNGEGQGAMQVIASGAGKNSDVQLMWRED